MHYKNIKLWEIGTYTEFYAAAPVTNLWDISPITLVQLKTQHSGFAS